MIGFFLVLAVMLLAGIALLVWPRQISEARRHLDQTYADGGAWVPKWGLRQVTSGRVRAQRIAAAIFIVVVVVVGILVAVGAVHLRSGH